MTRVLIVTLGACLLITASLVVLNASASNESFFAQKYTSANSLSAVTSVPLPISCAIADTGDESPCTHSGASDLHYGTTADHESNSGLHWDTTTLHGDQSDTHEGESNVHFNITNTHQAGSFIHELGTFNYRHTADSVQHTVMSHYHQDDSSWDRRHPVFPEDRELLAHGDTDLVTR